MSVMESKTESACMERKDKKKMVKCREKLKEKSKRIKDEDTWRKEDGVANAERS